MSDMSGKISAEVLTEASSWFIDFNEGDVDAAARTRFTQWLRKSPEHVSAYIQIAAAWEDAPLLQQEPRFDREALYALAAAEGSVTPLRAALPAAQATASPAPTARRFTAPRWQAIAACLVLACGIGVWFQWQRPPVYQTHIGEQRSIVLKDGSTLSLNARSRVRVAFSRGERRIDLLEGQALFDVAKDPSRPFLVHSGTTVIRAVGTQFDVNRTHGGTVVTVLEGRIAVSNALAPTGAGGVLQPGDKTVVPPMVRLIGAGERITVARSRASVQKLADPSVATAWTQRKLIFDGAPLSEVVEEFNRYNQQQIVLTSDELARVRISASFSSVDSRRLVQFLQERFDASVDASATDLRISAAAASVRDPSKP